MSCLAPVNVDKSIVFRGTVAILLVLDRKPGSMTPLFNDVFTVIDGEKTFANASAVIMRRDKLSRFSRFWFVGA